MHQYISIICRKLCPWLKIVPDCQKLFSSLCRQCVVRTSATVALREQSVILFTQSVSLPRCSPSPCWRNCLPEGGRIIQVGNSSCKYVPSDKPSTDQTVTSNRRLVIGKKDDKKSLTSVVLSTAVCWWYYTIDIWICFVVWPLCFCSFDCGFSDMSRWEKQLSR